MSRRAVRWLAALLAAAACTDAPPSSAPRQDAHSDGDEQGAAVPPDTMGIFVFFSTEPVVTAPTPCAGCTVTVARTWVFDASPAT